MNSEHTENPRETGRKVWQSFSQQMAEGGGFFNAMFLSFKRFIRKYFISLLIFGIIGAGISIAVWFMKHRFYQSEMTVSYVHYEKKIYADMLAKLDQLLMAGSYDVLSELLDMPGEPVKKIHSIKSYNIRKEPLINDLGTEKLPFYITVKVSDQEILPQLQNALVSYLNNTKYIQSRLEFMRNKSLEELKFLNNRLNTADSLSRLLIFTVDKSSDEKAVTRMELLEETMAIYSRIQEVRGLLEFNVNIEVLDGFVATNTVTGQGLVQWIIYGFFIGMGIRLILLVFS